MTAGSPRATVPIPRGDIRVLIAFEGIDGAGKTTTAPLVAAKLAESGLSVIQATKRASGVQSPFASEQLDALAKRLWGVPHDARLDELGTLHWIYLNAAFFAGTHFALTAEHGPDTVVVFDNWINKFLARVTSSGEFKLDEVIDILRPLPQPDLVFFLDVPPDVAAARKEGASDLERGFLHDGRRDFVGYQTIVRQGLVVLADRLRWTVIEPVGRTADEVADDVAGRVRAHLASL
jgi:thymidylate kinase